MIQCDKETDAKLTRLWELRLISEGLLWEDGLADCDLIEEAKPLRESLVEEFLPFIKRLAQAGLLDCVIRCDEEDTVTITGPSPDGESEQTNECNHLMGSGLNALKNGVIVIACEHSGSFNKRYPSV